MTNDETSNMSQQLSDMSQKLEPRIIDDDMWGKLHKHLLLFAVAIEKRKDINKYLGGGSLYEPMKHSAVMATAREISMLFGYQVKPRLIQWRS